MATFMATSLQFFLCALLITYFSVLADSHKKTHVKSSIDFHFGIVRSRPNSLLRGKVEKKELADKKAAFQQYGPGAINKTLEDDYEKDHPKDCRVVLTCSHVMDYPYRTADGSCNNLKHPDWGSAFQPYRRLLRPEYDDRMSTPRIRSKRTGQLLPSPREVSRVFHSSDSTIQENQDITHMVMQWGQFLDHDISITPIQANLADDGESVTSISCCPSSLPGNSYGLYSVDNFTNCFPIPIPADDPSFAPSRCMSFTRSVQVRNDKCRISPVEQLNQITAFIDASNVYGSSDEEMNSLRTMEGGSLKCRTFTSGSRCPNSDLLPSASGSKGFQAGDVRANEQPGLASMHTLFLREHNRIAGILQGLNGHWDDEKLFQETRKIIGAMMQVITYKEYLPIILGGAVNDFNLVSHDKSKCMTKHPPNPTIVNAFSAAAYRFGHSQIRASSSKCESSSSCSGDALLSESFGDAESMVSNTCLMEDWLRGLTRDYCPRVDRFMSPQVTVHMFEDEDGNSLDLAALNIQRGRDHGLPGYNHWRKACGLRKFNKFSTMMQHSELEREKFAQLYSHPDDIDLFTAGVSEKPAKGGLVGQTFSCLLGRQFQALKEGDRFWYQNTCRKEGFTDDQLNEIEKVRLSEVICKNTQTQTLQRHAFKAASERNRIRRCNFLIRNGMQLSAWKVSP